MACTSSRRRQQYTQLFSIRRSRSLGHNYKKQIDILQGMNARRVTFRCQSPFHWGFSSYEEGLRASLSSIRINKCPLLKKQWQSKKGKEGRIYWMS